jgi:bifunctional UDP-N-acetylglucosamine pyrophosphorylase/glucosamine-1-phosphate N-acetyltransferase
MILAAGEGSRMRSDRPKPLHYLCGRPMLMYVLDALAGVSPERTIVVVGHRAEQVTDRIAESRNGSQVIFRVQEQQRGTGDAVIAGLVGSETPTDDAEDDDVLILPGDTPLLRAETVSALIAQHRASGAAATLLTAALDDPSGYGRVVRKRDGHVERIVEHRDASPDELAIAEVNTSIYVFRHSLLAPALRRLEPDNSQGEYYLTDVVEVLSRAGYPIESMVADDAAETGGVNDRLQLAVAEAELRQRTNDALLRGGVTMVDPATTYVDTTVTIGRDVTLFPGTMLHGDTVVGDGCEIGPNTRIVDCRVGDGARIEASSLRDATVGTGVVVGPYAAVFGGDIISDGTETGAFYTSAAMAGANGSGEI